MLGGGLYAGGAYSEGGGYMPVYTVLVQSKLDVSEFCIPDLSLFRIRPDASLKFVCKHRIFLGVSEFRYFIKIFAGVRYIQIDRIFIDFASELTLLPLIRHALS